MCLIEIKVMGLFFRKRVGLGPLNLNLSKSGIGFSLGVRGFHAGISSSGRRYVSAGLPGTGIAYRKFARKPKAPAIPVPHEVAASSLASAPAHPVHVIGYRLGYAFGWLLMLSPLALLVWLVAHLMR